MSVIGLQTLGAAHDERRRLCFQMVMWSPLKTRCLSSGLDAGWETFPLICTRQYWSHQAACTESAQNSTDTCRRLYRHCSTEEHRENHGHGRASRRRVFFKQSITPGLSWNKRLITKLLISMRWCLQQHQKVLPASGVWRKHLCVRGISCDPKSSSESIRSPSADHDWIHWNGDFIHILLLRADHGTFYWLF